MTANQVISELQKLANESKRQLYARFFKTGKGEYGEGDKFLGLTMPQQRTVAKKYKDLTLKEIKKLLKSKYHEHRMVGLVILTYKYPKASPEKQKEIYEFYLDNRSAANNWDLIDVTTPRIIGVYLLDKPKQRKILYKFAKSNNLWERRIAMLATSAFIWDKQFEDAINIAEILVKDNHDLIHKAVGWMLREIGKKDQKTEEKFLMKHYKTMPRTMLRYAIEKFDDKKRKFYMGK